MSDSLPDRPDLGQLRRRAKELRDAARAGDAAALERVARHHPTPLAGPVRLAVAQLVIARELGFSSWPGLIAARTRPEVGERSARLLRRLVSGEGILVIGIVFAAAVLSSLAPPPPAFALQNSALAKVGPGTVARTVTRAGYQLELLVTPNRAAAPDMFELHITKGGQPVRGANVTLTFAMTTMEMPNQEYQLTETRPGVYARAAPALVMVGIWGLTFQISPPGGTPFNALILDQANG